MKSMTTLKAFLKIGIFSLLLCGYSLAHADCDNDGDDGDSSESGECSISPPPAAAPQPPPPDCGCESADPVDSYTGVFIHRRTDLAVRDVIPLEVARTYRSKDGGPARAFGINTALSYDVFLIGEDTASTVSPYLDLVKPNGSRVHFVLQSPVTTPLQAVYVAKGNRDAHYAGATIKWSAETRVLTLKDGSTISFGLYNPQASLSYYRSAAMVASTDRLGNTVTYKRAEDTGNLMVVTSPNGRHLYFTYDEASNRVTQVTDDIGRTVTYQYTAAGELASVTDPLGNTESYTYDSNHQMLTVTDKNQHVMVANTYDATTGRVSKQTYADGTTATLSYQLDTNGKLTQLDETDERGIVKRLAFNTSGYPTSIINALGKPEQQTWAYTLDSVTNQVLSTTDPLGRVTGYTYDVNGNQTQVTQLQGTSKATSWSYTYDSTFNQVTSLTDPLSHTTKFTLDAKGRVSQITDPLNNQVSLGYDNQGNIQTIQQSLNGGTLTNSFAYSGGDLASTTDPLGRTYTFLTDSVGRRTQTTDPLGNAIWNATYDNLDRITTTTDALGNSIQTSYDPMGNLLSYTDGKNQGSTTYTWDTRNRLLGFTDNFGVGESYNYDAGGNRVSVTDRKGQISSYTYDNLNRLTKASYGATASAPSATSTVNYTWDAGNRVTQIVDSASGTITRSYDGLDNLTEEKTPQGQVDYSYYANSLRQGMTVLGQSPVAYTWDATNRLTQINQGSATVGFAYDSLNRRTQVTLPSGIQMVYGYDNAGQLTSITYQQGSTVLDTLTYGYDATGHRTSLGGSAADTITQAPTPVSPAPVYDAANRLATFAGNNLTYDANGSLLSANGNNYTWDARNRLTQIAQGSSTLASYQYDSFGRRIGKTLNGGTTINYLYDGNQIVQELNGSTVSANLLTGLGLDEIYRRTSTTAGAQDYLTDALGSTIALVNSAGTVQTRYAYDPYGNTTVIGNASDNPYQYTGRENDGNGLYYYRARYYNPQWGRFISQDPMGFAAGQNLYAYVSGDPIAKTDPQGLYDQTMCEKAGLPAWCTPNNPPPKPPASEVLQKHFGCVQRCLGTYTQYTDQICAAGGAAALFIKTLSGVGEACTVYYGANLAACELECACSSSNY
ncbi:RHS repeat-associated core domain-containing protein [Uliginosibacterium gangwonense]|uniref:RHS repeat-associated core domain-containing protein n=1 Tax=Uliginosibacterium gangwonense TaxID=392736 RepID=UPI0003AB2CF5|nr:RHS repeat-associated core domain-containing protein [Uliginosibacterium gangwonense]